MGGEDGRRAGASEGIDLAALTLEVKAKDRPVRTIDFAVGTISIGREKVCDIFLPGHQVSRRHAAIRPTPEGFMLIDLGSRNGTRVNGTDVQAQVLHPGDEIQIGRHVLTVRESDPHWSTTLRNMVKRSRADGAKGSRLRFVRVAFAWITDEWTLARLGVGVILAIAIFEMALALGWAGSSTWQMLKVLWTYADALLHGRTP